MIASSADRRLERVETIVERQRVCRRKATTTASSSIDSTVDRASFGPVRTSATEAARFQLATVFWLIP